MDKPSIEQLMSRIGAALDLKIREIPGAGTSAWPSWSQSYEDGTVLFAITPNATVGQAEEIKPDLADKKFKGNWKLEDDGSVTISAIQEVEATYTPVGAVIVESGEDGTPPAEWDDVENVVAGIKGGTYPPDKIFAQTVTVESGGATAAMLRTASSIVLEGKGPKSKRYKITESGHKQVHGSMPIANLAADSFTDNNNRYLPEFYTYLQADMAPEFESAGSTSALLRQGHIFESGEEDRAYNLAVGELLSLPPTAMMLTHASGVDPKTHNPMDNVAAKMTGFTRHGDIVRLHFETLDTDIGDRGAGMMLEGFLRGASFRHVPYPGYSQPNDRGGSDYRRVVCLGADFTNNPAVRVPSGTDGLILEAKGGGEEMDLEKLKKENPEAYAQLMKEAQTEAKKTADETAAAKAKEVADANAKRVADAEARATAAEEKIAARTVADEAEKIRAEAHKLVDAEKDLGEIAKAAAKKETDAVVDDLIAASKTPVEVQAGKEAVITEAKNAIDNLQKIRMENLGKSLQAGEGKLRGHPSISTLDPRDRNKAVLFESAGSDQASMSDILVSLALNRPVYSNGKSIFESYDHILTPIRVRQQEYLRGVSQGPLSGIMCEAASSAKDMGGDMLSQMVVETGEQTMSTTMGTGAFPYAMADALTRVTMARSIVPQLCNTRPMGRKTVDIPEEIYRRAQQHDFGCLSYGGSWDAADGTYPDDLSLLVATDEILITILTAVDTATTFTITGTTATGGTGYLTVYVAVTATHPAGTVLRCQPTVKGEKFTDITGASGSGWGSAGKIVVWSPAYGAAALASSPEIYGTEGAALATGRTEMRLITATAEDHELGAHISLNTIEELRTAVMDLGGQYDAVGRLIEILAADVDRYIDSKLFQKIYAASTSTTADWYDKLGSSLTFASTTVPSGMTPDEHKATLEYTLGQMVGEVAHQSNQQPTWMVINTTDKARFFWWMRESIHQYNPDRANAFHNSSAAGSLHGCQIYVHPQQFRGCISVGNAQVGLWYLIFVPMQLLGPQWNPTNNSQSLLRRQRSIIKITQPRTIGQVTVS